MTTHILVIDDDPLVRYSVRTILEGAGHEVTEADNGRGGLECFRATRFDAVITDIIMPDMEGIETIRAIRALDRRMPVLAMSGGGRVGNTDFLKAAKALGADQVLQKPFEDDELLGALARAMESKRAALRAS
jgi:CheY-like chemotaxis protein